MLFDELLISTYVDIIITALLSELPPVQQQAPGGGHHDPLQLRRGPPAQPAAHPRMGTLRTRGERDEVGGNLNLYNIYIISKQWH